MKTPFPHFGAKHRVAHVIWERFGNPSYYYEPFGGSLGTLLERPESSERQRYEYVGDADCLITNFFRAAKLADPDDMARLTDWPASQLDLEARTRSLKAQRKRLVHNLTADPNWFDLDCAAWFVWVQSVKISTNSTMIVLRRTCGVRRRNQDLSNYFAALSKRLKNVTIHYGDWTKLANAAEKESSYRSDVAILLDPPYKYTTGRQKKLYTVDSADVAAFVYRWALARSQTHPKLKIALCGLAGEHKMPDSWAEVAWTSKLGKGRERIWFSPSCQVRKASEADTAVSRVVRVPEDWRPMSCR